MQRIAEEYGQDVDVVLGVGGGHIDAAELASVLNKEYMTVPQ